MAKDSERHDMYTLTVDSFTKIPLSTWTYRMQFMNLPRHPEPSPL